MPHDPGDRPDLAALELAAAERAIDTLALEHTELRLRSTLNAGQSPGLLSSMIKVYATELSQQIDELLIEARGIHVLPVQNAALGPDELEPPIGPAEGAIVANAYINNRASTIYGGSAQIQRNIIARRVLGL
jgi:alkylation response protein AidB-like acyl-CoA dehydrogenase